MKQKNKKQKLQRRIRDYSAMINAGSNESKVNQRMNSGGYTMPGSLNK